LMALMFILCWSAFPGEPYFSFSGLASNEIATDPGLPLLPSTPYSYTTDSALLSKLQLTWNTGYEPVGTAKITDDGATLGRVLFYDRRLSDNYKISCGSCHKSEFGFADSARFSKGFKNQLTKRNSMGLANVMHQPAKKFFWSGTADTIQSQVLAALQSDVEMGMNLDTLVKRIADTDFYPPLFERAFGNSQVTPDRVAGAIAQFTLSMTSTNSKFDIGFLRSGQNLTGYFPNFTAQESRGKQVFTNNRCQYCHSGTNFTMTVPMNTGLEMVYDDKGLGAVTGLPDDMAKFKAPPLRNVALTAPYMHDGRFKTLEEVVDHYSTEIEPHPNLHPFLDHWGLGPKRFLFTQREKEDLIAFLHTLTDPYFITDPRWQDPFTVSEIFDVPIYPTDTLGIRTVSMDDTNPDLDDQTPPLKILGNPVRDVLRIELLASSVNRRQVEIKLLNLEGKVVRSLQSRQKVLSIPVVNLPAGTYVLQVKHPDFVHTEQIVKQ